MNKESKIYIAGHRGLVGSAIVQSLKSQSYQNLIYKTHAELDLCDQTAVETFFKNEQPEYVFLAAAKVGGIVANNTYRADFIYENLQIQNNVIHAAYKYKVKKLLFLGSTCIYPKNAPQPMSENSLLTSPLEYTNEPYAIAKIAGIKLCESYNIQYSTNFISVMPTNLYGYNDNFDLEKSHVLPALIRKIYLAKLLQEKNNEAVINDLKDQNITTLEEALNYLKSFGVHENQIEIWGSGTPRREFMWSQDMADACVHIMQHVDFKDLVTDKDEIRNTHINIGTGQDISIKDLAYLIKEIIGYEGELYFNTQKLDGTLVKLTDSSKLHSLGFKHKIELEDGIKKMYNWYKSQK
jgi:GDP-L-fucose synthase